MKRFCLSTALQSATFSDWITFFQLRIATHGMQVRLTITHNHKATSVHGMCCAATGFRCTADPCSCGAPVVGLPGLEACEEWDLHHLLEDRALCLPLLQWRELSNLLFAAPRCMRYARLRDCVVIIRVHLQAERAIQGGSNSGRCSVTPRAGEGSQRALQEQGAPVPPCRTGTKNLTSENGTIFRL